MKAVILTLFLTLSSVSMTAQEKSRLTIGGYGEAVMTRNFYSQSFNRYKTPENYANDPSHGRFDLPHICLNIGYNFGKGWTLGTEIEFEHGGNGTAVEIEAEEAGEYEAEVEKAGFTEYIERIDPTKAHPEWHTGDLQKDIYTYLTSKQLDAEMTDTQYKNLMITRKFGHIPTSSSIVYG